MTSIFYYLPEDGDEEEHPNMFSVNGKSLTLRDVREAFPLEGGFHFRFKKQYKGTFVWLDVFQDLAAVPTYDGVIVSKVTRLSTSSEEHVEPPPRCRTADANLTPSVSDTTNVHNTRSLTPPPRERVIKSNDRHSSGDLLGLHSPVSGTHVLESSAHVLDNCDFLGTNHNMMGLDWESPPLVAARTNSQKKTIPAVLGSPSIRQAASPSKLHIASDLSTAAKDFKL